MYKNMQVNWPSNRITKSVLRELDLSYSPPSLGGEGISGAGGVKGQAKLSARLGGRVGLAEYSQHPPRAFSHSQQLVFPVLDCMDDVVQDGPMDHLSISLAPFSSIKSSSRVGVSRGSLKGVAVVGKSGRGRASRGSTQPQLIYSPKRREGERRVDRGMDRNACRGEEKYIFYRCKTVVVGWLLRGWAVCIFSLDWRALDMLLM